MTVNSGQRNRRALILLGVAVTLYLATSQFVLPWYDDLQTAPREAADKTDQLRRYRRELLHKDNYDTLTADVRKKIADAGSYFFTDPAELQKVVEESAKTVGIDLAQRSAPQTKKIDDMFNEITMTVTFESTPGQVVRFLDQLRQSPKLVNVRTAQIDPTQAATEAPKTGELRKALRANLTIQGDAMVAPPEGKGK